MYKVMIKIVVLNHFRLLSCENELKKKCEELVQEVCFKSFQIVKILYIFD